MKQIRLYLKIAFLSAMIGLAARLVWFALSECKSLTLKSIIEYMCYGLIFGTVTLVSLSYSIQRLRNPIYIFVINLVVHVFLMILLFAYVNSQINQFPFLFEWVCIFLVTLSFSTLVTVYWYKHFIKYNQRLETKKESLRIKKNL